MAIKPKGIPAKPNNYTFNTMIFQTDALDKWASEFINAGQSFNRLFKKLGDVYKTPSRDLLLNSTNVVESGSDSFGKRMKFAAKGLRHYAIVSKEQNDNLRQIKKEAYDFRRRMEKYGDEWKRDDEKVKENNRLIDRVENAVKAVSRAEKAAYNAIIVSNDHQLSLGDPKSADHIDLGDEESGSDGGEPPWGTREASPSVLERTIWDLTHGMAGRILGGPLGAFHPDLNARLVSPVLSAAANTIIMPFNSSYHFINEARKGNFNAVKNRALGTLRGFGTSVAGLAMYSSPGGIALKLSRDGHLGNYDKDKEPDSLKRFLDDSDKAGFQFFGADKFRKGDILGGSGTVVANVGGIVAARKIPAGFGASKLLGNVASKSLRIPKTNPTVNVGKLADSLADPINAGRRHATSKINDKLDDFLAGRESARARRVDEGVDARTDKVIAEGDRLTRGLKNLERNIDDTTRGLKQARESREFLDERGVTRDSLEFRQRSGGIKGSDTVREGRRAEEDLADDRAIDARNQEVQRRVDNIASRRESLRKEEALKVTQERAERDKSITDVRVNVAKPVQDLFKDGRPSLSEIREKLPDLREALRKDLPSRKEVILGQFLAAFQKGQPDPPTITNEQANEFADAFEKAQNGEFNTPRLAELLNDFQDGGISVDQLNREIGELAS